MSELKFRSTKYNKPYYYDPVSNKTSWSSFGFDINNRLIERANNFKSPDLTKNPMDINPNYAVKSRKYGYNYFFNTEIKTSKWEIPRIPVDRIMSVSLPVMGHPGMGFYDNSEWEQIDSNYDVIMKWLYIHVSTISFNNDVDLPLKIDWVNKNRFRVRTNVYDALSSFELGVFYDLLKEPDDDGNYPLYYNLDTKRLSLVRLSNTDRVLPVLVFLRYDDV